MRDFEFAGIIQRNSDEKTKFDDPILENEVVNYTESFDEWALSIKKFPETAPINIPLTLEFGKKFTKFMTKNVANDGSKPLIAVTKLWKDDSSLNDLEVFFCANNFYIAGKEPTKRTGIMIRGVLKEDYS